MRAIQELEKAGYIFWLEGGKIQFKCQGADKPAPDQVKPLFEELKQQKRESINYLQGRKEKRRQKVIPFPYPINETLGIGEWDPMDIRNIDGKPRLEPGWWKKIPNS